MNIDNAITLFNVIEHPEQYKKQIEELKTILKKNEFTLSTIGKAKEINGLHESAKAQRQEAIDLVNETKQTISKELETARNEAKDTLSSANKEAERLTRDTKKLNEVAIEREKTSKRILQETKKRETDLEVASNAVQQRESNVSQREKEIERKEQLFAQI